MRIQKGAEMFPFLIERSLHDYQGMYRQNKREQA